MTAAVRRAWIPALLWLMVIAAESGFGTATNTSRLLGPLIHFLWPRISPENFELLHAGLRKAGHFFGYAVLSLLLFRAWWSVFRLPQGAQLASWREMFRQWSLSAASVAFASSVLVAALDEFNQSFLPGRTSSPRDVLLDSGAAMCAQMFLVAISSVRVRGRRGLARVTADDRTVVGSR